MSQLKNKSELNRAAADFLQKQNYFPSVIHCTYYSCVQLMKHILIFTLGKTEAEISHEIRNSNSGSHEVMINNINDHLKNNNKDWKTFNTNINQLKRLRVIADYENTQIDCGRGNDSIRLSDVVLKHLRSNIKI